MELGAAKKRSEPEGGVNGDVGFKKSKQDTESFTTGIGGKLKPCTKFFSTSGCPYGEGCHYLHYVPGGIKVVTQILGSNPALPSGVRSPTVPPSFANGSSPSALKTRLCNKFNSAEGCKFGDKCHFAHGEWELGRSTVPSLEDARAMGHIIGRYGNDRVEQNAANLGAAASFGASSTAKISIDASLAGPIIGKGGVNSKQISRVTGVKLFIRDNESDPSTKTIELEGSFDQINQASQMVQELIVNVSSALGRLTKNPTATAPARNLKTKLCENFSKGSCTYGERCNFAHGAEQLRKPGL